MEPLNGQDSTTGSIGGKTILASGKPSTAVRLKPSRKSTSIESEAIKPVSLPEALSLLQTLGFDLRSLGCMVSVITREELKEGDPNKLYFVVTVPPDTGTVTVSGGHIRLNGVPVSDIDESATGADTGTEAKSE